MGALKKIIDFLNQPIGGKGKNGEVSIKKREKNLRLKEMELTSRDALKHNKNIRYMW